VLQAWKDLLQNTVEDSMPAALSLEQESPVLHVSSVPLLVISLLLCQQPLLVISLSVMFLPVD